VYNVGGGPNHTLSVLDLLGFLKVHLNKEISFTFSDWRPGDQPVFVSDIRRIEKDFGWSPAIPPIQGVETLLSWIRQNQPLLERLFGAV
jgi:CDP-paratose 2-epimerase